MVRLRGLFLLPVRAVGPGRRNMIDLSDDEILPLSLEHNFWTWSAQAQVKPIPVSHAKGCYFWDTAGRRYLDFNSMVMCVNIGHGDERLINALCTQIRELAFAGPHMATKPRAVLGKILSEIMPPGLTKFLYTLGGADANENAIKLARAYTGRHKILARYRSYHGATFGALSATGDPRRVAWEPGVMPGVVHFLDPYRYRSTFHQNTIQTTESDFSLDYLNHLEEIIRYEGSETIAALLIEPVTGANGIIIPPEGYLQGVRYLCDKYGILLIADEVMSGFGRTGRWFAVNHWDVTPDLMTMAKGMTSGYAPLGGVAIKAEIADSFNDRVFQSGLTFNGHPLSLAAAIANIQVIQNDGLIERSAKMGSLMSDLLSAMAVRHESIGEVRSLGLFAAIELVRNKTTKEPLASYGRTSPEMEAFRQEMLDQGVYLYTRSNIILLVPPLIIKEDELREGLSILDKGIEGIDTIVMHGRS